MAHIENLCGYCAYLKKELEYISKGKFPCERDHEYHYADQDAPDRCFTGIFWRDIDLAKEAVDESRRYKGIGCHIVTAIIEILSHDIMENGGENKAEALKGLNENLRAFQVFRGAVMGGNPIYRESLMKYDIVAPMIASKIKEDPNRVSIARSLYNRYILACATAIREMNPIPISVVVAIYGEMMRELANIWPVSYVVGDVARENYNPLAGPDISPFEGNKEHSI